MAFVATTTTAVLNPGDRLVTVTSTTGIAAGMFGQIDGEQFRVSKNYVAAANPVALDMRGIATLEASHVSGARIVFGLATDFAGPAASSLTTLAEQPGFDRFSYNATGAITLPQGGRNAHVQLIGAAAILMTLANPTVDMDGTILVISSITKFAHTVTITSGLGSAAELTPDISAIEQRYPLLRNAM